MNEYTTAKKKLTTDERNLLSVAYKNVVGSRRSAWRVLQSLSDKGSDDNKKLAEDYRGEVERELQSICQEVLVGLLKEQFVFISP